MENHYSNQPWWKGQQITPSPNRQSVIVIVWRSGKPSGQVFLFWNSENYIFGCLMPYIFSVLLISASIYNDAGGHCKILWQMNAFGKERGVGGKGKCTCHFWSGWLNFGVEMMLAQLWLQRTPGGFGEQRAVSCVASQGQTFKGKDQLSTEAVYVKVFRDAFCLSFYK